jgi:aryl-alcohol dehydrogenase-like predicted oxidoreductase
MPVQWRSQCRQCRSQLLEYRFSATLSCGSKRDAIRTGLVDAVQVIWSIFDQSPEDELSPACQELNIGVIARVALDEGSLGGK